MVVKKKAASKPTKVEETKVESTPEKTQACSKESFLTACLIHGSIDIPNYGKLTEMSYKKAIITGKDLDNAYDKYS